MRLDHLALTVTDRERSAAFYAEHFGFASRARRTAFRQAAVEEPEWQDTPDGASGTPRGTGDFMVLDPDGYRVELYAYGDG